MIKQKLPKEQYENIPLSFIIDLINNFRYNAEVILEEPIKERYNIKADALEELIKRWIVRTVAEEPDVEEAAKKAYRDAVDSFAVNDGEPLIRIFKD